MRTEGPQESLASPEDSRRTNKGNIRHKLKDIIIGLCSQTCNGNNFSDMQDFGEARQTWLKQFLELPHGIPDSDAFRRVFERLNPAALAECLYDWLGRHRSEGSIVAINGKTIVAAGESHKAYHVVSAFVAENQLTLGKITTAEKSNEITALPELLDLIDVKGSIVIADATSCQKDIVRKIHEKKADYVITLKSNQPSLWNNADLYFKPFAGETPMTCTIGKDPGRIKSEVCQLATDISWLPNKEQWAGLRAIGRGVTKHIWQDNEWVECRYYIASLTDVKQFA